MAGPSIIVIGAGIIGLLVARELVARDPAASVTVLDQGTVGGGASRWSAGLHLPRGGTPRVRAMSARSHAYFGELRRAPGVPIYPVAATVLASGPAGLDGGPPGSYLPAAAAQRAAVPARLRAAAGQRAWRLAGCHYADVYALAQFLAAGLRPRVRFGEGVAVTGLSAAAGTVTVRCGTGEELTADKVVLAPGPWLAAEPWRDLLAPLALRVKKVAALHIERPPGPADQAVLLDDDDAFLLPLAHRGHWLFSYACQRWDVDPDGPGPMLEPGDLAAARDCLRRYSPELAASCHSGRAFCDAYSPAREPVVRALDPAGRIVFAGAACGSGYRLAPAIGSEVVDLLGIQRTEGAFDDHQYV